QRRPGRGAEGDSADDRSESGDIHRRPHNAATDEIGTKRRPVEKGRNLCRSQAVYENSLREARCASRSAINLLHRDQTLIELLTTLRGATSQVQKRRHNMQYIDVHGVLTQRSPLDRLRVLADRTD